MAHVKISHRMKNQWDIFLYESHYHAVQAVQKYDVQDVDKLDSVLSEHKSNTSYTVSHRFTSKLCTCYLHNRTKS